LTLGSNHALERRYQDVLGEDFGGVSMLGRRLKMMCFSWLTGQSLLRAVWNSN